MSVDLALPLYSALLAAVQAAAAIAIWHSGFKPRAARWTATVLVGANGLIALADMFHELGVGGRVPADLSRVADDPTAVLVALLVLQLLVEGGNDKWAQIGERALFAGAVLVALAALASPGPLFEEFVEGHLVFAAYTFAVVSLAFAYVRTPTWPKLWVLGAFLLRGSDFAVRFLPIVGDHGLWYFHVALFVGVCIAMWRLLSSARVATEAKVTLGVIGSAGALFGLAGILAIAPYEESLVTLSIGRPALLLVGMAPAGYVRPFFRMVLVGTGTFFTTVLGSLAAGWTDSFALLLAVGGSATALVLIAVWVHGRVVHVRTIPAASPAARVELRPPAAPQLEDWERLLEYLGSRDPDDGATRRDIADALGILPRNVPRVVDAANRSPRAKPGVELVRAWYDRGRRNQLEYRYALTAIGIDGGMGQIGKAAVER